MFIFEYGEVCDQLPKRRISKNFKSGKGMIPKDLVKVFCCCGGGCCSFNQEAI